MITKLMTLFRGLGRAYGTYKVAAADVTAGKKVKGKAVTVLGAVTEQLWTDHVEGRAGLGVIPITDDATCHFGAIDVDKYDIALDELEAKVAGTKLPLVLCRTKSGGAHLFLFCKEPITAELVRRRLTEWAYVLGYGGSEIFPKQVKLASERDVGNWINMPYFDAERTTRYALRKGKALKLDAFIKYAESLSVTAEELEAIAVSGTVVLEDGPPCLNHLASQGVPEGARNSTLFNFGVYARLRYGDDWRPQLDAINQQFMQPALSGSEVTVVAKSLAKKTYFYTCDQEPMRSCCNKELCRMRRFGIGHGHVDGGSQEPPVVLGTLTKIMTDPPIWTIDVDGVRMELETDDLVSQERFRKLCVQVINKFPPRLKADRWEKLIQDRLDNVEIVEAPADSGPEGLFWHHLRQFCTGPAQAKERDEILAGRVWTDDGRTWFRSADFLRYLDQQRVRLFDQRTIWGLLRKSGKAGHKNLTLKGLKVELWWVEAFTAQDGDFNVPRAEGNI